MQGTLLKEIDIKVDKTTNKFKVANKQMKQLLEEVTLGSHPPRLCASSPLPLSMPVHTCTLSFVHMFVSASSLNVYAAHNIHSCLFPQCGSSHQSGGLNRWCPIVRMPAFRDVSHVVSTLHQHVGISAFSPCCIAIVSLFALLLFFSSADHICDGYRGPCWIRHDKRWVRAPSLRLVDCLIIIDISES